MFVNKRYTITVYQRAIQGYNNLILQNYKDWHLFKFSPYKSNECRIPIYLSAFIIYKMLGYIVTVYFATYIFHINVTDL